jgi:tetratricopeptide (TPR) repeat protein
MNKYRVKLKDSRVIGPFVASQIIQLINSGKISSSDECQLFPAGDWQTINDFAELVDGLSQNKQDATFVRNLRDIMSDEPKTFTEENVNFPKEFKYSKEKTKTIHPKNEEIKQASKVIDSEDSNADKTIITKDTINYREQLKKELEEQKRQELANQAIQKNEEIEIKPKENLDTDSTQFIDLSALKEEMTATVKKAEIELSQEIFEREKIKEKNEKKFDEAVDEEEVEEQLSFFQRKKKLIYIILGFILIYVVMFPEEESKQVKIEVYKPKIELPVEIEEGLTSKSNEYFDKALKLLTIQTYKNKIAASKFLYSAVEQDPNANSALDYLFLLYSELFTEAAAPLEAANEVFQILQIIKPRSYTDPMLLQGIARFYYQLEKYDASVHVIDKYLSIKENKSTPALFAVYLDALVQTSKFEKAKKVYDLIQGVETKTVEMWLSLIEYDLRMENNDSALVKINKAKEQYSYSVPVKIKLLEILVKRNEYEGIPKVLEEMLQLNCEGSKRYYSYFYEYKALLHSHRNENELALDSFKEAIKYSDRIELRSRITSLEGGANLSQEILNESASISAIAKSQSLAKKGDWNKAFQEAVLATDKAPNFVPAQINLAELQISQGYFQEAIATFESLIKQNPNNEDVIFGLLRANIESFKFTDAQKLLSQIAESPFRESYKYEEFAAKLFMKMDAYSSAVDWLQKAINKNPINDELLYLLSEYLIKYKQFSHARTYLSRAIDLNPSKVLYRETYAKIIYETEDSNAAIGHLVDLLNDFPDNPRLYGAIGIYYYRTGQIKKFEDTRAKLNELKVKDESFYKFLMDAATLDQKREDIIKYGEQLLAINPGNIEVRMYLGQVLMDLEKYPEAFKMFESVKERLNSYPKLQYFLSKINLLLDKVDEALILAQKEVEDNPGQVLGNVLLGDIYMKQNEFVKAENSYKKAYKSNPNSVEALLGMAAISYRKNQLDMTIDLYKKAKSLQPHNPMIHKLLGDSYRQLGQSAMAIESYRTFLELFPESRYKPEIETYINMFR